MILDDFVVYFYFRDAHRLVDLFESQITAELAAIRSDSYPAAAKNTRRWCDEARQSLRCAFFLRYYALFEGQLKLMCDRFADRNSETLRLSDIRGVGFLEQVNKYLTKVVKCAPLENHRLWNDTRAYVWLRNEIVHGGGRIPLSGGLPQFVNGLLRQRSAGISLSKRRTVILKRHFCYRAIRRMGRLIFDIQSGIDSRTPINLP